MTPAASFVEGCIKSRRGPASAGSGRAQRHDLIGALSTLDFRFAVITTAGALLAAALDASTYRDGPSRSVGAVLVPSCVHDCAPPSDAARDRRMLGSHVGVVCLLVTPSCFPFSIFFEFREQPSCPSSGKGKPLPNSPTTLVRHATPHDVRTNCRFIRTAVGLSHLTTGAAHDRPATRPSCTRSACVRYQHARAGAGRRVAHFRRLPLFCDMDFLRTEIPWVDYMRDRADADEHILIIPQATGAGGSRYTLEFIGLRHFAGRTYTLQYTARADDTEDTTRRGIAHTLVLGLVLPRRDAARGATRHLLRADRRCRRRCRRITDERSM